MTLTLEKYTKSDGGVIQLLISGHLDTETSPQFDEFVQMDIDQKTHLFVLDMKHLEYISSAGIRSIFKFAKQVKSKGCKIAAVNRQPQIAKVFDIVKALPDMKVFRDDAEMDVYLTAMQKKVINNSSL